MGIAETLTFLILLLVSAALLTGVVRRVRKLRKYAYFRVASEGGEPLAGGEVFTVGNQAGLAWRRRVGKLDQDGAYCGSFTHVGPGTLLITGPGLSSGRLAMPLVSEYDRYPIEPYECRVAQGLLLPPSRPSAMSRGLAPGDAQRVGAGFTNRYEAPELHEEVLCYATLEELKQGMDFGKGMNRYWKIHGTLVREVGAGQQISAESWERLKG